MAEAEAEVAVAKPEKSHQIFVMIENKSFHCHLLHCEKIIVSE